MILILPIYNVWKLQMRTRHKISVIAIFFLGGFTTITGIMRLHFLTYAFSSLRDPLFSDVTCKFLKTSHSIAATDHSPQTITPLHSTGQSLKPTLAS